MLIINSGDKSVPVYEVEMELLNPLSEKWEHKWEYVRARDSADAKNRITWVYGQMVDFLSVKLEDQ